MIEALLRVTDALIAHRRTHVSAAAVTFLVRRYLAAPSLTLHGVLANLIDPALAQFEGEADVRVRIRWLGAFSDAVVLTTDESMTHLVGDLLPDALDDLERFVRAVYEPGEGAIGHGIDGQALLALSLLTAFDLSGRVPYAMLAEELLQPIVRQCPAGAAPGAESGAESGNVQLAVRGQVAQLCYRMSALRRDPDYRTHAVVAPRERYEETADALLEHMTPDDNDVASVAERGLALADRFALHGLPN